MNLKVWLLPIASFFLLTDSAQACNLQLRIMDVLPENDEVVIKYYDKSKVREVAIGSFTNRGSRNIKLPTCVSKKESVELIIQKNETEQILFRSSIFKGQPHILFGYAATLADSECFSNCSYNNLKALANRLQKDKVTTEFKTHLKQTPNLLSRENILKFRELFSSRVKGINIKVVENSFIYPPKIGEISKKGPSTSKMLVQWRSKLFPNLVFNRHSQNLFEKAGLSQDRELRKKIEEAIPNFQSKRFDKGFMSIKEVEKRVNGFIKKLDKSTDKSLISFKSILTDSLYLTQKELKKSQKITKNLEGISNQIGGEIAIANWFRYMHAEGKDIDFQLALFSNRFKKKFIRDLKSGNKNIEPYLRAVIKKYSEHLKYKEFSGFSDHDAAAFNEIVNEAKGKVKQRKNKLELKDENNGVKIRWVLEDSYWKLDNLSK